jgi:Alpha-2-macroglobulin bait region domain
LISLFLHYFFSIVGKKVSIKVESSTEIEMVHYIVIGRTGILISKNESFPASVHEFEIKFMATSWMVPEAQVLIYYIHYTGEVIYDQLNLPFEENLPNKV